MGNKLKWEKDNFFITTDKSQLQISRVHKFLSTQAYWCLDIPITIVEKAIAGSICFGLFCKNENENIQIGFARVVSDCATFAWLCDVYVEDPYRGRGLSKWLMECVLAHPELKNLRRFCLTTKDAHELYKKFGFKITETPQYWMEIKDNDIYKRMR